MAIFSREPFSGITPDVYASLSDRQIVGLLHLGNRDRKQRIISEARLRRRAAEPDRRRYREVWRGGRDLPPQGPLGLDDDTIARLSAVNPRVPVSYLTAFFQVWRGRGLSAEETAARYERKVREGL